MKKILAFATILILAACQAPYQRNVYKYTAPKVCVEYRDAFRCSAPTQVWHETVYPKNIHQMNYEDPVYLQQSLSKSVYGTY